MDHHRRQAAQFIAHPVGLARHALEHRVFRGRRPSAVALVVDACPRSIGGDQDPQGISTGRAGEPALDPFAPPNAAAAVEGSDARFALITAGDQRAPAALLPVPGVGVVGKIRRFSSAQGAPSRRCRRQRGRRIRGARPRARLSGPW